MNVKKDKKPKQKDTGTSATGKPNDIIDTHPQLKTSDNTRQESVDLTHLRAELNMEFSKFFSEETEDDSESLFQIVESMIESMREDDPLMADQLQELLDKTIPKSEIMSILEKKAEKSGLDIDVLAEIFCRGAEAWTSDQKQTKEQYAYSRVNSFIAGGKACEQDSDLLGEEFTTMVKRVPYRDPRTGSVVFRSRRFTSRIGARQRPAQLPINRNYKKQKATRSTRRLNQLYHGKAATRPYSSVKIHAETDPTINDAFSELFNEGKSHKKFYEDE